MTSAKANDRRQPECARAGTPAADKIVLLTGNHLCHNPRAFKSADALARHGWTVEVLGAWSDSSLKARDQQLASAAAFTFTPVIDLTAKGVSGLRARLRRRAGTMLHQAARVQNRWQLGYALPQLIEAAMRRPAALYIAHSEEGLAAADILRRAGRRVGVDMEDWFSEDLPPEVRRGRPVGLLRALERSILTDGVYASCPSAAMSDALAQEFGCPPPAVVYNAFSWSERSSRDGSNRDRVDPSALSIHWCSQTLGAGRGLEDLIAALPHVRCPAEIHLRGSAAPGFAASLIERVPDNWKHRLFFHPPVSNGELLPRISEHDIGFAGEMTFCRSRDLTVTNKMLHYLLAGLAVVASDTRGQREVHERAPGAVMLYAGGNSAELAKRLNALLGSPQRLAETRLAAANAAEREFCWERQEPKLLDRIRQALSVRSARTQAAAASAG